jgi:hypothetical protein
LTQIPFISNLVVGLYETIFYGPDSLSMTLFAMYKSGKYIGLYPESYMPWATEGSYAGYCTIIVLVSLLLDVIMMKADFSDHVCCAGVERWLPRKIKLTRLYISFPASPLVFGHHAAPPDQVGREPKHGGSNPSFCK